MAFRKLALILLSTSFVQNAFGFCTPPSMYSTAPDPPSRFSRPEPPFCLSGYQYSGTHTCSEWEIDSYIRDINEYISKLSRFVEEAEDYSFRAQGFADEAVRYANCEATEVKKSIE